MSDSLPIVFGFIILAIFMIASLTWTNSRSQSVIELWARANLYEIINSEVRYFFRGPFFWSSSKGQTVYYITVKDAAGNFRSGWIRCGSWWGGLFSDQAEVRWDDDA
jgi:hypothetical protein